MASASFLGDLAGKVGIITGASSGIGAATAVEFARHGIRLGLHGRSLDRLKEVQKRCVQNGLKEEDIILITGELTNPKDMEKVATSTLEKFGTVNILVNNAGSGAPGMLSSMSMDQMDRMFHEHVKAPLQLTQLLWQQLIDNKGSIVNISSDCAHCGVPGGNAYGVAKAAMSHLTKALSSELAAQGVRVNAISPGAVKTSFLYTSGAAPSSEESKQALSALTSYSLQGTVGAPEEFARMILFLASDACRFMIGQDVVVDGGSLENRIMSQGLQEIN